MAVAAAHTVLYPVWDLVEIERPVKTETLLRADSFVLRYVVSFLLRSCIALSLWILFLFRRGVLGRMAIL